MDSKDEGSGIANVVNSGRVVFSADHSIMSDLVQHTIASGKSATFYVSRAQGLSIMRWYWTDELVSDVGLKAVPKAEISKIEKELGVKVIGQCFSNYLKCPNGHTYGMYEFVKQGIAEHGPEYVKGIIGDQRTSVIRVNPGGMETCPTCAAVVISGPHYYSLGNGGYQCCRGSGKYHHVLAPW